MLCLFKYKSLISYQSWARSVKLHYSSSFEILFVKVHNNSIREMSSSKSEYFLATYKTLSQVPALLKAKFINENTVQSIWSQRNLEQGKVINFQTTFIGKDECNKEYFSLPPVDITNRILHAVSPCQKYEAVIREIEGKEQPVQYLEIWTESALIRSIDLNALDLHGKVYADDDFGSFKWCPTESKLLYVAERKVPKIEPLNKRLKAKKETEEEQDSDIIKYEPYRQDWGEALVGKVSSVIVIYDVTKDEFTIPDEVPENICVAKPFWNIDGDTIMGIAYYTEPRKLGLIYCANRHSSIFSLSLKNSTYFELSALKDKTVKSPQMTPDGKNLIWLQCEVGGPHINCMQVFKTKLPLTSSSEVKLILDKVCTSITINENKKFYGLYNVMIPERCWTNDQKLLFSTIQKNWISSYLLDIDSGKLTEFSSDEGSLLVLDVCDDNILINQRNYFRQDNLFRGKISDNSPNSIEWNQISKRNEVDTLKELMFTYMNLSHENDDAVDNFTAIYVGPQKGEKEEVPLIVFPHGGPHSASINAYSLEMAFLLSVGYAVLQINYRGSIGAGQKSLEFLPGKAGTSDVADCVLATKTALTKFPWLNPKRVSLVGGSHGGFLVTHLSGQYPDMYRAVVARNPVIDIATMSTTSDIPDWCYVEAGFDYTQKGPINNDILLTMRQNSPIIHAHKVKAPTLLQIGLKDLRVPPAQGMEYYHRLKANNINVCMNVYDDNHPLGKVPNEIGHVLTTVKWLEEHSQ